MKKIFKWAGYAILPLVIVFAITLFWEPITYFILGKVIRYYAAGADIALEIGRVSGNPLSSSKIERISIRPGKGLPQTYRFEARSVTCTYNLWDLKEGYEIFLQGVVCKFDNPEFFYNLELDQPPGQPAEEPAGFIDPGLLPEVELHNCAVVLHYKAWDFDAREINAILRPTGAGRELQMDVKDFRLLSEGTTKIATGFTSLVSYSGAKLTMVSLKTEGDDISAKGFLDLDRVTMGYAGFGANLEFGRSGLNISGSVKNRRLQTSVTIENFDIAELQRRLGGSDWDISGKIKGQADFTYNLEQSEFPAGSFALNAVNGRVHGVDVTSANVSGSLDKDTLNISGAEATVRGSRAEISDMSVPLSLLLKGDLLQIIGKARAAEFGVETTDTATVLQLFKVKEVLPEAVRPHTVEFTGHLGNGAVSLEKGIVSNKQSSLVIKSAELQVPATAEAFSSLPFDLAATFQSSDLGGIAGMFGNFPLAGQLRADLSIRGTVREPQAVITANGEYLGFKEMQLGAIALQGEVQVRQEKPWHIDLVQFTIQDLKQNNDSGTVALLTPVNGTWKDGKLSLVGSVQADGKSDIAFEITIGQLKEVAAEITTRGLDSDGWLANFISVPFFFHGADAEFSLRTQDGQPHMQLAGTVSEIGGKDVPFPLAGSFALNYAPEGIHISEFSWKASDRSQLEVSGYLPYDPLAAKPFLAGELTLDGHADFRDLGDIAPLLEPWGIDKGSVVLDMALTGSWDKPVGHILLRAKGLAPPEKLKQYLDSSMDLECDIVAQDDSIILQAAELESASYTATVAGSWRHLISLRELSQIGGEEIPGEISADATVRLKDLNFLRKGIPWLRRLEGDMQGKIHVSGPAGDPAISGSFSLEGGEASHNFNFPMVSAINLHGDFDQHSISINSMQAEVGGSPVNLEGRMTREGEEFEVNLNVNGKNVLLFRNNDMWIRGDVQLDVKGPLEHLALKGTTGLTGGYYTRKIDFLGMIGSSSAPVYQGVNYLFSFQDPPLRDAVLDIKITTIEPFRIRNNLIRGVLRPELSLKGTGELPFLVGTIYIDPSRVLLPSGRLQVQSGLLRFLEGEPDKPQLNLIANSKVLGYDINVVTQGPIDDPVISLSSSPALSNEDLLLLLLTGQPPKEKGSGEVKSSGSKNVMVYLGRDFLNKWLEDESGASNESILDRFYLEYGRDVTKSGEETIEGSFRISDLETGKRKVYYLTAEKDKYDAYNYGLRLVFRFE